jgi:hypothetical protein
MAGVYAMKVYGTKRRGAEFAEKNAEEKSN